MTRVATHRPTHRDGVSLVEVVVAIVIFAGGVLGTLQMGLVARQQARTGEIVTDVWAVAQIKLEEMRAADFDNLSAGSDTIGGYPASWTVTGTDPKTVTLSVTRPSMLGGKVVDSIVVLIPDWND